jgi:hypothetical protein
MVDSFHNIVLYLLISGASDNNRILSNSRFKSSQTIREIGSQSERHAFRVFPSRPNRALRPELFEFLQTNYMQMYINGTLIQTAKKQVCFKDTPTWNAGHDCGSDRRRKRFQMRHVYSTVSGTSEPEPTLPGGTSAPVMQKLGSAAMGRKEAVPNLHSNSRV